MHLLEPDETLTINLMKKIIISHYYLEGLSVFVEILEPTAKVINRRT